MSRFIHIVAVVVALHLAANPPLQAAPVATFRLQVEDLADNPISAVNLGQDFQLAAYVEDIRDPAVNFPGVWAAFMNVAYEAGLVSISSLPSVNPNPGDPGNFGDPGIEWGAYFDIGIRYGDLSTPGLIDEIGSGSLRDQPSGLGEELLWKITIHTSAVGTVTFIPSFDSNPEHESSFINPPTAFVDDDIQFIGDSVQIVPEPSSLVIALLGAIGLTGIVRRKQQRRAS
jgi:hypothetical protein